MLRILEHVKYNIISQTINFNFNKMYCVENSKNPKIKTPQTMQNTICEFCAEFRRVLRPPTDSS